MRARAIPLLICAFAAACGGIREVGGGGAWRTQQPTLDEIEFAARGLGVKTVVSLRAKSSGKPWYDAQVAACERLGVGFESLGWSARGVTVANIEEFVTVLARQPGPYLFHCRSGKDRTSLAAAVYRVVVLGHSKEDAEAELSFFPHGHLPWFGFGAVDRAFEAWEPEGR